MKNNLTLKNSGRRREQEQITTVDQEIQINLDVKVRFTTRCCTYRDILLIATFLQIYHHYHYRHNLQTPQWSGVGWKEAAEVIPRLDKVLHHKENEKKTGAIRMESKRHINYHARQAILKEREKKYEVYTWYSAGPLMIETIRKSKCLIAGRVSLLK